MVGVLSLLLLLATFNIFSNGDASPFCFSTGLTWSSPVSDGVQSVETPDECQLLCADSIECDTITWYDGQASPHPNYCEMFPHPHSSPQVPCTHCMSGPGSCICSGEYTCSLDSDLVVDVISDVTSELLCAERCFNHPSCHHYSWYSLDLQLAKDTCALLRECTDRAGSVGCVSGSSDCVDSGEMMLEYPLCFKPSWTWSEDEVEGVDNITSPHHCQEVCRQDYTCSSFTWFNSASKLSPNSCMLFPSEIAELSTPCSDCVSGKSFCTCSVSEIEVCSTVQEAVLDIFQHIESEDACQDLCARHEYCSWYTWYSEVGVPLQFVCVLLSSCEERMDCQGCSSGPGSCDSVDQLALPQCLNYRQLTSHTRNVKTSDEYACDGNTCCDITTGIFASHAPPDWAGEGYYRFTGLAGSKMPETASVYSVCGTSFGGYLFGGHPTVAEGEVTRVVYFDDNMENHDFQWNITVTVSNCRGFYVYYLPDVDICDTGYCGQD